jgi:hypothetical protein
VDVLLTQLSQVGVSACHCLRVLDGWVQIHTVDFCFVKGVLGDFERKLKVRVATMAIGRVTYAL